MELDEMKATWEALSNRLQKQEVLTNQVIEKMTTDNYRSKVNRIAYSEYIGTIICYIGAAYLITNFPKITGITIQILCITAVLLLFTLPVISLKSVKGLKNLNISTAGYAEILREYMLNKVRFQRLQKWNVVLALLLLLTFLPVITAIMGKDITTAPNFWTLILPIGILLFSTFAIWVLRYYNRILRNAEEELKEIDN